MKIQHEGGQLSHLCFHPTSCDRTWFFALDPTMSVVVRAAVSTDQLCWACCGIWKSLSGREIEPRAFANYYSSVWNVMFALLSKIQLDTQTRDWKYSGSRGDGSSANSSQGGSKGVTNIASSKQTLHNLVRGGERCYLATSESVWNLLGDPLKFGHFTYCSAGCQEYASCNVSSQG